MQLLKEIERIYNRNADHVAKKRCQAQVQVPFQAPFRVPFQVQGQVQVQSRSGPSQVLTWTWTWTKVLDLG